MALQGKLKVVEGFVKDKLIVLPKEAAYLIGRDRICDMSVMSRRVDRKHARITCRNGAYALTDLETKTGTIVNRNKIATTVLRHNDMIQVGDIKMRFLLEDEEAPKAETVAAAPAPPRPVVIPPKPAPVPVMDKEPSEVDIAVPVFTPEELAVVGRTISGLKVIAALAKGRRTIIYKAIQSEHNRVVALRMLSPEAARNPAIVRWFIEGVQGAAEMRHEDTVSPLGGGRDGENFFSFAIFMENGSALERFADVKKAGVPAIKMALESLIHVVRALEFGQGKGRYHLGIRPTKIMQDEKRHAKLLGLGFDSTPWAPGASVTPQIESYRAPEQGGSTPPPPSAATDIYSLGATFYYMLTAHHPKRDRRGRVGVPKLLNPAVPDSICRIVEKMTDPEPDGRYRTYGQLLHDLRWALRGEAWPKT